MWLMMLIMLLPVLLIPVFFVAPLPLAVPVYLSGLVLAFVYHRAMMSVSSMPVVTGIRGMVGHTAEVVHWENDHGEVRYHSELWQACRTGSEPQLNRGSIVTIVGAEGLTLVVQPSSKKAEPVS